MPSELKESVSRNKFRSKLEARKLHVQPPIDFLQVRFTN